ncbi:MAG TPA: hypothetical protein VNK52_16085 [Hyphomicrobiaceae bacterium]|nr:hypothetical protein [Hyphomicrobiaceae bacterium]
MSTRDTMAARIANELARDDLTTEIVEAINTAIAAYEDERWSFNESRTETFATVQGQEFYGEGLGFDAIARLIKVDYIAIAVGNTVSKLCRRDPEALEYASQSGTSTGDPYVWSWYANQIRLYPVPITAGRTVRVAGIYRVAAPATGSETGNPWMIEGERLIRARAKWELYTNLLFDYEAADRLMPQIQDAVAQMDRRRSKKQGTGIIEAFSL